MKFPRYVYVIKHNHTGKVYVGSAEDAERRYSSHLVSLRSHKHPVEDFQDDFDKFGEDLTFRVVDVITKGMDDAKEYEWIERYSSFIRGVGYNYKDPHFNKKQTPRRRTMHVSEGERALIELIRGSNNPLQALERATEILKNWLAADQRHDRK